MIKAAVIPAGAIKPRPKRSLKKALKTARIVTACLFVCVFGLSIASFIKYNNETKKTEDAMQKLRILAQGADDEDISDTQNDDANKGEYVIAERFLSLYAMNRQLVGWIKIDGTSIDYPVMHSPDDEQYYLRRDFEGNDDNNGIPFLDARCTIAPKNQIQIVYGHNIRSGIMFHDLVLFEDEKFYREHQYIKYDTLYEKGLYQIVAAFRFDVNKAGDKRDAFHFHRFTEFTTKIRFGEYKESVEKIAYYDTGVEYDYTDRYLIVATCEYTTKNSRMVLLAKEVSPPEGEG